MIPWRASGSLLGSRPGISIRVGSAIEDLYKLKPCLQQLIAVDVDPRRPGGAPDMYGKTVGHVFGHFRGDLGVWLI